MESSSSLSSSLAARSGFSFGFVIDDTIVDPTTTTTSPIEGNYVSSANDLDHITLLEQQQRQQQLPPPTATTTTILSPPPPLATTLAGHYLEYQHDNATVVSTPTTLPVARPMSHPFAWIEPTTVTLLLIERAQQEMVYSEIPLRDDDDDDNDCECVNCDDDAGRRSLDHDDRVTSSSSVLRCIDLSMMTRVDPEQIESLGWQQQQDPWLQSSLINPLVLTTGIYEGGLQLWEGSLDLVRYLATTMMTKMTATVATYHGGDEVDDNNSIDTNLEPPIPHRLRHILELGCGHGLPGCFLLRQGMEYLQREQCDDDQLKLINRRSRTCMEFASDFEVTFVDFNYHALRDATISNIVLNVASIGDAINADPMSAVSSHVQLGHGDWMDFSSSYSISRQEASSQNEPIHVGAEPMERESESIDDSKGLFDFILAAETTYSLPACQDMAALVCRHLQPDTGVALISTKRYYFGVGGGADPFRQALLAYEKVHGRGGWHVNVETVRVYDSGVGNIRELLQVRKSNVAREAVAPIK